MVRPRGGPDRAVPWQHYTAQQMISARSLGALRSTPKVRSVPRVGVLIENTLLLVHFARRAPSLSFRYNTSIPRCSQYPSCCSSRAPFCIHTDNEQEEVLRNSSVVAAISCSAMSSAFFLRRTTLCKCEIPRMFRTRKSCTDPSQV